MAKWTEQTFGQVKGADVAKWTANKGTKPGVGRAKKPWQGSESTEERLDNMFQCLKGNGNKRPLSRAAIPRTIVNWALTVHRPYFYKCTGTSQTAVFTNNHCLLSCGASDIPLQYKVLWKRIELKRGETQVAKRPWFSCLSCIEGEYSSLRWTQKGLGLQQPTWHQPTTNASRGVVTLGRCHETESAGPQKILRNGSPSHGGQWDAPCLLPEPSGSQYCCSSHSHTNHSEKGSLSQSRSRTRDVAG